MVLQQPKSAEHFFFRWQFHHSMWTHPISVNTTGIEARPRKMWKLLDSESEMI